jgi:hypothetical protein
MDLEDSSSNFFIKDMLTLFEWSEPIGVFASNNIPNQLLEEENFTIVCNLSRIQETGTHFISLIKRGNRMIYIDPLGIYIELNNDISSFIEKCNPSILYKIKEGIQDIEKSFFCGLFCIYFSLDNNPLLERPPNLMPFESNDLIKNDCICLHNIAQYINSIK